MSSSKEACLWSYNGGCVVQENVMTMAEQIKGLLNLPSDTDNIELIQTIRLRLEETSSTDKDRNEATRLVTDLLRFSVSGCNNCAFKKAVQNYVKER
jgi:hypothetical protein